MDEKRMNYYLDLVPPEIRDAAAGLHDDKHWAVFIALLENGDIRFSELKKEFGLESTQMIRLLRDLGRAGLVAQYTDDLREIESRTRSFYKVTTIGSDFVESLMDKFLPQEPQIDEYGVGTTKPIALNSCSDFGLDIGQTHLDSSSRIQMPLMTADASEPTTGICNSN